MIKLNCNNYLVKQTLTNFFENKNFSLASENDSYFTIINVHQAEKSIDIIIGDVKKEILLPADLNHLSSEILKSIVDINIPFSSYYYFPF